MNIQIKVLKDTPFDNANTVLSTGEFRSRYSYLLSKTATVAEIITLLDPNYANPTKCTELSNWFVVLETFSVGSYVWHEQKQTAFIITEKSAMPFWQPNEVSLAAVNRYHNIYKRLATKEEAEYYALHPFHDDILIGEHKCYYHRNTWGEITNIKSVIKLYLKQQDVYPGIGILNSDSSVKGHTWECKPNGLKIGCREIPHEEIMRIARILKLT